MKLTPKYIISLAFAATICYLLSAQQFETQITKITNERGETPSATFSIIEDSIGFIWFGTIDGLYRYDGFNYKIYRNEPDNLNSLSNNTIRAMTIDRKGLLWIATQGGGLNCFDPQTETFTRFQHSKTKENEISGNSIWSVMVDKSDNIWIGVSGAGIDEIDISSGKISHYNPLSPLNLNPGQPIRSIEEDNNGILWIGIPDFGFVSLNPETGETYQYKHEYNKENSLTSSLVHDIFIESDNKLWIATFGGGINIFDPASHTFDYLRHNETNVNSIVSNLTYSITERIDNEYWIATEYGLSIYNAEKKSFRKHNQGSCSNSALSENRIRHVFIDSKGIAWIGSESGVDKINIQSKFELFRYSVDSPQGMTKGIVRTIVEDNNEDLWFGLIDNGITKYSRAENKYYSYKHIDGNERSLPGNNINAIFQDSRNRIWIGEWNNGLCLYNKESDNFQLIANAYLHQNTLPDNRIQAIIEDKYGILWIGTEAGLCRFDPGTNEFLSYKNDQNNSNSLSGNSIQTNALRFDNKGDLWIGTWGFGLNKMTFSDSARKSADFKCWKHDPKKPGLINDNIISLYIDKEDYIWIGSFGGGLSRFDEKTGEFIHYSTENGLPNNVIFAILEDKNENLWMSTDNGISMFNKKTEEFQNYTRSNGLQDNHFFWGASHASSSGKFYFGGINGINGFFPEKVNPDSTLAKPVLVSVKLFNTPFQINKTSEGYEKLDFEYSDNFISFEFASLDYFDPEKNQFQYMLEGFNKDWVNIENSRSVSFTNLKPGDYTFCLKVSNSDGIWNHTPLKLEFKIHPPWWKTWWAISLFVLICLGIVFSYFNFRFKFLHRQNLKLEQQVGERTHEVEQKNTKLSQTLEKLKKTQQALVNSEKIASIGVLAAGLAHEVRNPLNFIALSVQQINSELHDLKESNYKSDEKQVEEMGILCEHAETGIKRINKIVNSLQSYLQKDMLKEEKHHIDEIVISSVKLIAQKIPGYLTLNYKLTDTPGINVDKHQLSQVIINILDNAIDAINEKKEHYNETIEFCTQTEKYNDTNYIKLSISNTGPSIPNEIIKNLFDPFFTTKPPNKGTGLGLYLSQKIINELKGLMFVENIDKKVIFNIYLPIETT
ncbi:MAG: GHKL domain-containing protein [Bacteroidales bacterium]|nr:GHKL domain-containing protein [Bacteroidales bacterium]MBN2819054.1 GHKL domain-containing protein [Bacteroidales bacterium]